MSFSVPKNVPNFENSQRTYENVYWGTSSRTQQDGHINHRLKNSNGGFFENKELPMYKDKPYNYAVSQRYRPLLKRKRVWVTASLSFLAFVLYLSFSQWTPGSHNFGTRTTWKWRGGKSADWDIRREAVKEVFERSWDGYKRNAWGMDEYHPIAKTGRLMTPTGLGWIIVDALDSLMIMNLTSRLSQARDWISTSLRYDQDTEVNTFETTIRMLGGLLSAHYLSTQYPSLAPLSEDDAGEPGEDLYLETAADLADRLLGAFDSPSGIPYASVNLKTLRGIPSHDDAGASSTAEAASIQLEFKYLTSLTGEKAYWDKVEKVIQVIDDNGMEDGLLPIFIYADRGTFRGDNIRLGSRGDSYYEYLIKQYLQTSKQEPVYLELWNQALSGIRKHLIAYSKHSNFTILAERPNGLRAELNPKMDHLVCFMPGTIALGATEGLPLAVAKKSKTWGKKQEEEMELARELMKTCWGMYKASATGLAGEITHFEIDDPPRVAADGKISSAEVDFTDRSSSESQNWKSDFIIKQQDSHNLQRPETVESLFYMWRITGDVKYREWGWEMFESFVNYTEAAGGGGFTSLWGANEIPPAVKDNMESFWLAETLKYFYLLFSPTAFLPLDQIIFNTEAHIFPRFQLTRGLTTGWTRKARDAQGHLIVNTQSIAPTSTVQISAVSQGTMKTIRVVATKAVEKGEPKETQAEAKSESGN